MVTIPANLHQRTSIFPRLENAAFCTIAWCLPSRIKSIMAAAVIGFMKAHEAGMFSMESGMTITRSTGTTTYSAHAPSA